MSTTPPIDPTTPEPPKTMFERLGAALPVAMTALATVFAGMSAAQLQRSMYWKSQSAVDQSKAANQWALAGFKRDRALIMEGAAAQLHATSGYAQQQFVDLSSYKPDPKEKDPEKAKAAFAEALERLNKGGWPRIDLDKIREPYLNVPPDQKEKFQIQKEKVEKLAEDIQAREPEAKLLAQAGQIKQTTINDMLDATEKAVKQVDDEWDAVQKAAMRIPAGSKEAQVKVANKAAVFDLQERRYRGESYMNQQLGRLYEVRLKVSAAESDKFQSRSTLFFYAMLAAQIGSTVAALAMNRKKGAPLSIFAAVMGLLAGTVGGFVLLQQYVVPIIQ